MAAPTYNQKDPATEGDRVFLMVAGRGFEPLTFRL